MASFCCFPYGALLLTSVYALFCFFVLEFGPSCDNDCRKEGVDNASIAWTSNFFVALVFVLLGIHVLFKRKGLCRAWMAFLAWAIAHFLWGLIGHSFGNDGTLDGKGNRGYFILNWLAYAFATDCLLEVAGLSLRLWITLLSEYRPVCFGKTALRFFQIILIGTILMIATGCLWCASSQDVWVATGALDEYPNDVDDVQIHTCIQMIDVGQVVFTAASALLLVATACIYGASARQQIEELDKWYFVWGLPTPLAAAGVISFQVMILVFHLMAFSLQHSAGSEPDDDVATAASMAYHYSILMTGYLAHNFIAAMSISQHANAHQINRRNRRPHYKDDDDDEERAGSRRDRNDQPQVDNYYDDIFHRIQVLPSFPSIESSPSYQADYTVDHQRRREESRKHSVMDDTTTVHSDTDDTISSAAVVPHCYPPNGAMSRISEAAAATAGSVSPSNQNEQVATTKVGIASHGTVISQMSVPTDLHCWPSFLMAQSATTATSNTITLNHENKELNGQYSSREDLLTWLSSLIYSSSPVDNANKERRPENNENSASDVELRQADDEMRQQALDPPAVTVAEPRDESSNEAPTLFIDNDDDNDDYSGDHNSIPSPMCHIPSFRGQDSNDTKYSQENKGPTVAPPTHQSIPDVEAKLNDTSARAIAEEQQERRRSTATPSVTTSVADEWSVGTDQAITTGPTVNRRHQARHVGTLLDGNLNIWAVPEGHEDVEDCVDSNDSVAPAPDPKTQKQKTMTEKASSKTSAIRFYESQRQPETSTTYPKPSRIMFSSLISGPRTVQRDDEETSSEEGAIKSATRLTNSMPYGRRFQRHESAPSLQSTRRKSIMEKGSLLSGPKTIARDDETSTEDESRDYALTTH